jgi:hypothetical protein
MTWHLDWPVRPRVLVPGWLQHTKMGRVAGIWKLVSCGSGAGCQGKTLHMTMISTREQNTRGPSHTLVSLQHTTGQQPAVQPLTSGCRPSQRWGWQKCRHQQSRCSPGCSAMQKCDLSEERGTQPPKQSVHSDQQLLSYPQGKSHPAIAPEGKER